MYIYVCVCVYIYIYECVCVYIYILHPLVKNAQPSVITGWKWKAKIAVENAKLDLRMEEVIGTGKWKSWCRRTSTALVVQRIHSKQKKNGVGRNPSP